VPAPPRDPTAGRSLRQVPQLPVARPAASRAPARAPRSPGGAPPSLLSLLLWPTLITLAVTALRVVGELREWSPRYFSRVPGGGLAIVGITWLVPAVGAWLGWRLARAGVRGPTLQGLVGWPAASLAVGLAMGYGFEWLVNPDWYGTLALWGVVAVVVGTVSFATWPALGKPLLLYAFAARLPVAAVMALGIWRLWGTHYDLPPPGFPREMPLQRWLWTGLLPQTTIWIAFTLAVGMAFAALGVWLNTAQGARGARR
jgi:hypothetical protein